MSPRWTDRADDVLRSRWSMGTPLPVIATALGRSREGVRLRLRTLGLTAPPKPVRPAPRPPARTADDLRRESHFARLESCHGTHRALAIIHGRDPATEADVAAWDGLGRQAAA